MKPRTIYLALCVFGAVLPYSQFLLWLSEHGFDAGLFVRQLFVNRISSFFAIDLIISAIALLVFVRVESARLAIPRRWLPAMATVAVGVSLGLPLFLYMRDLQLERDRRKSASA